MSTNPRRFEAVFTDLESTYEYLLDHGFDSLTPREAMFANKLMDLVLDIASDFADRKPGD